MMMMMMMTGDLWKSVLFGGRSGRWNILIHLDWGVFECFHCAETFGLWTIMQNRIRSLIIRNHQKPNCIELLNSPVQLTVVPELSRGDALLSQQRGGQCRVAASESIGVQWQPFTNLQTRRRVRFSKHSNKIFRILESFWSSRKERMLHNCYVALNFLC